MPLMRLADAIGQHVHDGQSVALEGFTHLIPFAAGHEIIRQRRRGLHLIRMPPDRIHDQMIGMGCADRLTFSWGGNPGVGSLHRLRDAIERQWPQPLAITERTHAEIGAAYQAGASGLPCALMRHYADTELDRSRGAQMRTITCPFSGERLLAVPAIDRKSTRLNSSHSQISYAVFCLKKTSSAVVRELKRDAEVVLLDRADRRLELVPGLARHPDLGALDLRLDLGDGLPDVLGDLLRLLVGDPGHERDRLADRPLRRRLHLAWLQRFQGDLAADRLLLEDLVRSLEAVLGRGMPLDLLVLERRPGVGGLGVQTPVDLARGLIYRVANLLQVDLRDDVEGTLGHGRRITVAIIAGRGGCPSGQRERSVKSPAQPTEVRILPRPPSNHQPPTDSGVFAELRPLTFRTHQDMTFPHLPHRSCAYVRRDFPTACLNVSAGPHGGCPPLSAVATPPNLEGGGPTIGIRLRSRQSLVRSASRSVSSN